LMETSEQRRSRLRLLELLYGSPDTPSERDFHSCGGAFVSRPKGAGRRCGACLAPEPEPSVPVRGIDGEVAWIPLSAVRGLSA
jgi:hypothetical protein